MIKMLLVFLRAFIILVEEIITGLFCFVLRIRKEPKNISGQLALVTGGARGLGKAIAARLAQEGCNLAICDVNIEEAQRTSEELRAKYKIACEAFKADVSDTKQVATLYNVIAEKMGTVDILVNNAGILAPLGILEGEDSDVSRVLNVNLASHFWMVRKFLPSMIEQRRGHILGIASSAGRHTLPMSVAYCASKFGTNGFYRSLYADLCAFEHNRFIKITCAYPGFINTRNDLEKFLDDTSELIPRIEPDYAADKIVNAMLFEKREIFFPFFYRFIAFIEQILPPRTLRFSRDMFSKQAKDLIEDRVSITRK